MNTRPLIAAVAAALLLGGSGRLLAQPSTSGTTPPRPARHGILGFRRPHTAVGSSVPISGGIVGNKRTHVYHLPGDTGNLPAAKNRVYFRSEAEATAAGSMPRGSVREPARRPTAGFLASAARRLRRPRPSSQTCGRPRPAIDRSKGRVSYILPECRA